MNRTRGSVVPTVAWVIAPVAFSVIFVLMTRVMWRPLEVEDKFRLAAPILMGALLAGFTLLVGYVYGDAKRRGMRYVMWTWLAALVPNGLGIVLYFILREPMPVFCAKCGGAMGTGFAYCPHCGGSIAPACPACNRVSQPGWSHCAYCGVKI
jgi:hypothetical protein